MLFAVPGAFTPGCSKLHLPGYVQRADELFAITSNGGVIRTPVKPVRRTRDRNTMGVKLMDLPDGVTLVAIARKR